jgi:hypothetical protein
VCETLLTRIEIYRGNALPRFEERDSDMQRCSRFSRATFLIAEHNNVRRLACFLDRFDQHAAPSGRQFSKYRRAIVKLNPS